MGHLELRYLHQLDSKYSRSVTTTYVTLARKIFHIHLTGSGCYIYLQWKMKNWLAQYPHSTYIEFRLHLTCEGTDSNCSSFSVDDNALQHKHSCHSLSHKSRWILNCQINKFQYCAQFSSCFVALPLAPHSLSDYLPPSLFWFFGNVVFMAVVGYFAA